MRKKNEKFERNFEDLKTGSVSDIILDSKTVTSEEIVQFFNVLKTSKKLEKLDLSRLDVVDLEGCKTFSEVLKSNIYLKELHLFKIHDLESYQYLCEGLKLNNSLQILNFGGLSEGNVGVEEIKYITEALKVNNALQKIDLNMNNIGNRGCKYISELLKTNYSLETIYLGYNNIENEGCKYLHEGLKNNVSLTELNLEGNVIDDKFLYQIEEKLKLNMRNMIEIKNSNSINWEEINKEQASLKRLILEACLLKELQINLEQFKDLVILNLRINELGSETIKTLSEFITWNSSLKILNLEENKTIGDKEGVVLLSALSFNFKLIELKLNGTSVSNEIQCKIKAKLKDIYPFTQTLFHKICFANVKISELILSNKISEVKEILKKESNNLQLLQEILFICCGLNQVELCKFILDEDTIQINFKLEDGNTYLHLSVMKDNYEISKLLLEKGIEINVLNNEGKSCRDLCISNGQCIKLFEDIKQLKVVILGKGEVGKTTLVKKILKPKKKGETKIKTNERTDGIEMHEWSTGVDNNNIIQLWDFGGQELFYTTHQFFLSENSIHLLLFNLTDKFMEKELFFWLNSIQYRAPKSKVIIIGSHMDKIDPNIMEGEINRISIKVRSIYQTIISNISDQDEKKSIEIIPCSYWENPKLKEKSKGIYKNTKLSFYPISGTEGWNINHLEKVITGFSFHTTVRKEFIDLKNKVISIRNEKIASLQNPIILKGQMKSLISNYFSNIDEIDKNLKLLHELGFILDFGMKYVIIHPQWLSNVFKSVISIKNKNQIKDGVISRSQIFENLKKELQAQNKKLVHKNEKQTKNEPQPQRSIGTLDVLSFIDVEEIQNQSSENQFQNKSLASQAHRANKDFQFLLRLMGKFQICVPKPEDKGKDPSLVIPSLLTKEKPKELESIFSFKPEAQKNKKPNKGTPENKEILGRKYIFPFIPKGIYENIFVKVASFLGSNIKFWENGFYIHVEEKGYLMFEIIISDSSKKAHSSSKSKTDVAESKGSIIQIKSTGYSNFYLISAFHYCIKEHIETNYPLLWKNVHIEIEYYYNEDFYFNSLSECLKLSRTNLVVNTKNGLGISLKKLIPEELDKDENKKTPTLDQLLVNPNLFIPGKKLGEGSYAVVYACKPSNQGGLCAIKQFKVMKGTDQKTKTKIQHSYTKELEIMKKLDHPNLRKLIGYNQTGDNWILVFPFYDISLEKLHEKIFMNFLAPKNLTKFPLENKEVQETYWWRVDQMTFIYHEILKGLEYLHQNLIAHLDLKADNILINLKDQMYSNRYEIKEVILHDFGTSCKLENKDSKIDKFVGSPYHMAPEIKLLNPNKLIQQIEENKFNSKGAPYNPLKADIFSFGILLCELVSNTPRLYHTNTLNKLRGHAFEKVILDCLQVDPDARPTTQKLPHFN